MSKKISQLTEVSTNSTSDVFVCNQSGDTKKTTLQKIADAIFGAKTDNNLPHYTGTPTQGTTAYEISGIKTISVSAGSAVATGAALIACYQVGKIVQVFIVGSAGSVWGGTSEILTGLPKPKDTNIRYPCLKTSAGTPYGLGTSYQVAINANGVMTPMYIPSGAIGSGDYFLISITYIAE